LVPRLKRADYIFISKIGERIYFPRLFPQYYLLIFKLGVRLMYISYLGENAMIQMSQLVIAAGILNVLVGIGYTLTVYTALERVPILASSLGMLGAVGIVVLEAWLGETLLSVTVAEMKLLTVVAVAGAVVGVAAVVTVFKPIAN